MPEDIDLGSDSNQKRAISGGPTKSWNLPPNILSQGIENVWHADRTHKDLGCHFPPPKRCESKKIAVSGGPPQS